MAEIFNKANEWVDYPDFAKATKLSYSTWFRWLKGKLSTPAPKNQRKIFGRWHVHKSELEKIYGLTQPN
jgi:hypothetical protein